MGLGWFDAIAGAALPVASGIQKGRVMAEEERRKLEEDALRKQLLTLQIGKAQQPEPWAPTTFEEYQAAHPDRTPPDYTPAQLRERAQAEHPERFYTPEEAGARARAEYPERFRPPDTPAGVTRSADDQEAQGQSILSMMGGGGTVPAAQKMAFSEAYNAIIAQHQDWNPGRIAFNAYKATGMVDPTLKPHRSTGTDIEDMIARAGAGPTADIPEPGDTPDVPTAPPPPSGANPSGKRPVTQDQADYLRATGQWDDARYEVVQ